MDERTRDRLESINRAFYDRSALEFSATRNHPWPGWQRVLDALPRGALRVLDVGCGNGRFAAFLGQRWASPLEYLGLDASAELLATARARCTGPTLAFEQHELLSQEFRETAPSGPYDLIALFGVLHHIPSFAARKALLELLALRLAPGGVLALTLWRFASSDRFRVHRIDWDAYNDATLEPIDTGQLEPGDTLVRFGKTQDNPRYCHACDDDERARLIQAVCDANPALHVTAQFRSDGRSGDLNDYLLFQHAARAGSGR